MNRTTLSSVLFARPFTLSGLEGTRPAGTYTIEIEEERLEGLSFPACRRLRTVILIPPEGRSMVLAHAVPIEPSELAAATQPANAEPDPASG